MKKKLLGRHIHETICLDVPKIPFENKQLGFVLKKGRFAF